MATRRSMPIVPRTTREKRLTRYEYVVLGGEH
jgi:hypothetical protein